MATCRDVEFYVIGIHEKRIGPDLIRLTFRTTRGDFDGIARIRPGMRRGVIMLGSTRGGFSGPCAVFPELANSLFDNGIASLRIDYRLPGDCAQCAIDALLGTQYLDDEGVRDVVLVGWSFGGAVAIAAGSIARSVRAVAAMSPVEVPGCCARYLQSKPVLILHGENDSFFSHDASRRICSNSGQRSRIVLYPGAGHSLSEARSQALETTRRWILDNLRPSKAAAA
jgi:pimeloyl-ACP methyl ester carboxylesterase